jgi:hypothetical protein
MGEVMEPLDVTKLETDARFPSGPWTGFFLQPWIPWFTGRQTMTIDLTFQQGGLEANGHDVVGAFTLSGSYDLHDGSCQWTKQYAGRHRVSYKGVNAGQGICGVWEISQLGGWYIDRGVFHIWPEGTNPSNAAEITEQAQELLNQNRSARLIRAAFGAVALLVAVGLVVAAKFLVAYLITRFRE